MRFGIVCTCRELMRLNLPTGVSRQSVCCSLFYLISELYFVFLGESLYNLCRGVDTRSLRPDQPRQSVSCDVNYGIRLTDQSQVENLFSNICKEVSRKLDNAKLVGKQVNPQNQCISLSNNFRFVLFSSAEVSKWKFCFQADIPILEPDDHFKNSSK